MCYVAKGSFHAPLILNFWITHTASNNNIILINTISVPTFHIYIKSLNTHRPNNCGVGGGGGRGQGGHGNCD